MKDSASLTRHDTDNTVNPITWGKSHLRVTSIELVLGLKRHNPIPLLRVGT